MDNFTVALHSIVDVITNSSSVIYTGVKDNAIDAVRALINDVLYQAGSHMNADDLYDIEIITEPREDFDYDDKEAFGEWRDANSAFNKHGEQVETGIYSVESGTHLRSVIVVTSKNHRRTTVSDRLAEIFYVEEHHG